MKRFYLLSVLSLLLLSCGRDQSPNPFTLVGSTTNIEDGTSIYLLDLLNNEILDSSVIRKNKFIIKGSLVHSPAKMVLMTDHGGVSDYLWLEPGEMVFNSTESQLQKSSLSGSATQKVYDQFTSQIDSSNTSESVLILASSIIQSFPDSRASAELLSLYFYEMPRVLIDSFFQILSLENQQSAYGQRVAHYLELNKNPSVGDDLVDFKMKNITGDTIRFSDLLGQVTLLHFWASWCDSCRTEIPVLKNIYSQYQAKGFAVFSVSLDYEQGRWEDAVQQDQLTWTQVCDLMGSNNTAGLIYGVTELPDNFLINKKGVVIARNLHGENLRFAIEKALK